MSGTPTTPDSTTPDYDYRQKSRTITEVIPERTPEPNKLIIELTNLSESSLRTVNRELKVVIEDFGLRKMVSDCIRVTEGK